MTPAELAAHGVPADAVWDGDDVEYALEKEEWERQETAKGFAN